MNLEDWQRFEPNRPQRTVDDVRRTLDDFLSAIGEKAADRVERTDVIRYRDERIGRGQAPKTVNKKITFICVLFNTDINNGKLDFWRYRRHLSLQKGRMMEMRFESCLPLERRPDELPRSLSCLRMEENSIGGRWKHLRGWQGCLLEENYSFSEAL